MTKKKIVKKYSPSSGPNKHILLYGVVGIGICIYIIINVIQGFQNSLFAKHGDRVNILVYGKTPALYSLGVNDPRDYIIPFFPDLKVPVPGGYGEYRVGALGKLVKLEQKPDIYRKTFALATSAFVDMYLYENNDDLYYGTKKVTKEAFKLNAFIPFSMENDANLFDKLYIYLLLSQKSIEDYKIVDYDTYFKQKGDIIFSEEGFGKDARGLFYQRTYRNEKKSVQILYTNNYKTAEALSNILEGNGIRVNDISYIEQSKTCKVKESTVPFSFTAQTIANFFNCKLEQAETNVYDILFELGEREEEWEIR
jgi:hypothetical protein